MTQARARTRRHGRSRRGPWRLRAGVAPAAADYATWVLGQCTGCLGLTQADDDGAGMQPPVRAGGGGCVVEAYFIDASTARKAATELAERLATWGAALEAAGDAGAPPGDGGSLLLAAAVRHQLHATVTRVTAAELQAALRAARRWAGQSIRVGAVQVVSGRRAASGPVVLKLTPGMAFGTGHHPTTQQMLWVLQELLHGDDDGAHGPVVVDVGTGSGILALAAAHLGAARVIAVDTDPVAVAAAREALRRNPTPHPGKVRVAVGSCAVARRLLGGVGQAHIVLANILAPVLVEMAPQLAQLARPGGWVVGGGMGHEQWPSVRAAWEATGRLQVEVVGEWGGWAWMMARAR